MEGLNGWESLEIRHLRAFATIARLGSFAATAVELGYTQSAVSHQLRALENRGRARRGRPRRLR
jgi:DNA-binding transcriptional LysR family regulator